LSLEEAFRLAPFDNLLNKWVEEKGLRRFLHVSALLSLTSWRGGATPVSSLLARASLLIWENLPKGLVLSTFSIAA
jgi:hypothetical protein